MKVYYVRFYSEWNCESETTYKSFSNKQAIKKAIKFNRVNGNNKYIQVWRVKKKNSIKIFGNGNIYLYGIKKGKKHELIYM